MPPKQRASRKSSPAAGSTGGGAKKRSPSKSRSKSASPSAAAATKRRQPSKTRDNNATAAASKKKSSRSRSPARVAPASPSPQASPPPKKKTPSQPRQATPTAAGRQRRVSAINHNDPKRSSSPTAAAVSLTPTSSSASPSRAATAAAAAGRHRREFGGFPGAFLMIVGLPVCLVWLGLVSDGRATLGRGNLWLFALPKGLAMADLFSVRSAGLYAGWLLVQLVLYCLPIGGKWVDHEGGRYHCNGLFALLMSMAGLALANWRGYPVGETLCSELTRLSVCACVTSFLVSACLYAKSRRLPTAALTAEAAEAARTTPGAAAAGCTAGSCCGTAVYEFFMGRELHPRLFGGRLDLKFFLEMRPSLIGWAILDMAYLYQAGGIGAVSLPSALLTGMHLLYIGDALLFERSILTTTDIQREGLGFMLTFGNLAWVPFFYSLSARQMIKHAPTMPVYCTAGIVLLNLFGYWLFRAANLQKDRFRREPHHPSFVGVSTIPTGMRGRSLLAHGFWGRLRHPNFTGDLIMALAWSLAAGFHAPLAWLYPVYLLALLVHRAARDERHCSEKYGPAWQRYRSLVPWRLVPRVY